MGAAAYLGVAVMTCPECAAGTHVYDTSQYKGDVYRKRVCRKCGLRFYTMESPTANTAALEAFYNKNAKYKRRKVITRSDNE